MNNDLLVLDNRYKIHKLLKNSPFTKVYIANDIINDKNIIIKAIDKNIGSKYEDLTNSKIKKEIEIPTILSHKNIVSVLDFVHEENFAYVIYPYIENNQSLSALDKNKFCLNDNHNLKYMINIMCQICDAIEYMHSKNIVHRDIKPQNIIVNENIAFLIDFEYASEIDNDKYPIQKGIVGTPLYIAPELFYQRNNINYKLADIYSFGITLYYVFNKKKLPYKTTNLDNLEYIMRNKNPIPSHSKFIDLDNLIMTNISKNPIKRLSISNTKNLLLNLH